MMTSSSLTSLLVAPSKDRPEGKMQLTNKNYPVSQLLNSLPAPAQKK
jgi:hypothetical protein